MVLYILARAQADCLGDPMWAPGSTQPNGSWVWELGSASKINKHAKFHQHIWSPSLGFCVKCWDDSKPDPRTKFGTCFLKVYMKYLGVLYMISNMFSSSLIGSLNCPLSEDSAFGVLDSGEALLHRGWTTSWVFAEEALSVGEVRKWNGICVFDQPYENVCYSNSSSTNFKDPIF